VNGKKILYLTCNDKAGNLMEWMKRQDEVFMTVGEIDLKIIKSWNPDIIVSYSYKYIIKREIIDYMNGNIINLHISYLPWNRGADPNFWSFMEDTPKGVSIHRIDDGIDTGDIIIQKRIYFDEKKETFFSSYNILQKEMIHLFKENWLKIKNQEYEPYKQEGEGSFHYAKDKQIYFGLSPIDWHKNIYEFKNRGRFHEKRKQTVYHR